MTVMSVILLAIVILFLIVFAVAIVAAIAACLALQFYRRAGYGDHEMIRGNPR